MTTSTTKPFETGEQLRKLCAYFTQRLRMATENKSLYVDSAQAVGDNFKFSIRSKQSGSGHNPIISAKEISAFQNELDATFGGMQTGFGYIQYTAEGIPLVRKSVELLPQGKGCTLLMRREPGEILAHAERVNEEVFARAMELVGSVGRG